MTRDEKLRVIHELAYDDLLSARGKVFKIRETLRCGDCPRCYDGEKAPGKPYCDPCGKRAKRVSNRKYFTAITRRAMQGKRRFYAAHIRDSDKPSTPRSMVKW